MSAPSRAATPAPRSASACRPSGSRTRRPGSPGRTTRTDWPGKFAPIPWVFGEIVAPARAGRARAHPGRRRARTRRRRARGARRGSASTSSASSSSASRPTAAGRATSARSSCGATTGRRGRDRRLALQRLGEVPRPQAATTAVARRAPRRRLGLPPAPPVAPTGRAGRARGRRDRRQRRGHAAHDRGVPARPEVQARNPGFDRARTTSRCFARLPGRRARCSGSAAASPATTRTATSTTSRRFVDPRHGRARAEENDPTTRTTRRSRENRERLRAARRPRTARALRGRRRCRCRRRSCFDGQRLPASYANFYIAQRGRAGADLQRPERPRGARHPGRAVPATGPVVGIHAVDLVWGLGTLHCLTQQQPRPTDAGGGRPDFWRRRRRSPMTARRIGARDGSPTKLGVQSHARAPGLGARGDQAASDQALHALERSRLREEGGRRDRAVSQSAAARRGFLR